MRIVLGWRLAAAVVLLHVGRVAGIAPAVCAVVCDAGSTGTRAYSFWLPAHPVSEGLRDMKYHLVGKVKPGISSFAGKDVSPEPDAQGAVKLLKPLLEQAASVLFTEFNCSRTGVPIWVLASAGVRLLSDKVQKALWQGLQKALLDPFSGLSFNSKLVTRTISGEEEGLFALVGANFLTQLQQQKAPPSGVLDLGGSSTQIGVPPADYDDDPNSWRRWARLAASSPRDIPRYFFVRSYLSFGMVMAREKVEKYAASASASSSYPCAFSNYPMSGSGPPAKGVGGDCRQLIQEILDKEKQNCAIDRINRLHSLAQETMGQKQSHTYTDPNAEEHYCLGGEALPLGQKSKKTMQFWALSGYYFVSAFAHWAAANFVEVSEVTRSSFQTHWPNITLAELEDVADVVCGLDWVKLENAYSQARTKDKDSMSHTFPDQLPYRCFELNYLTTLLSYMYGFDKTSRSFSFVAKINNQDVEWPVGAFVSLYEAQNPMDAGLPQSDKGQQYNPKVFAIFAVACASASWAAWTVGRGMLPELTILKGYAPVHTSDPSGHLVGRSAGDLEL